MKLDDSQDYPEWRDFNKKLLGKISDEFDGDIIVPMTLYKKKYYEELIQGLRDKGHIVKHFLLEVTKDQIYMRLKKRNDGTFEWGVSKLDEFLEKCNQLEFTDVISNNSEDTQIVVRKILENLQK